MIEIWFDFVVRMGDRVESVGEIKEIERREEYD